MLAEATGSLISHFIHIQVVAGPIIQYSKTPSTTPLSIPSPNHNAFPIAIFVFVK